MIPQTQRAFTLALTAATILLWAATGAKAGIVVRHVNTSTYPSFSLSVVTDTPSTAKPRLFENDVLVSGATATNLGSAASVVLAVDRSRSMAGPSIADASAAADAFVTTKPAADAIEVVAFGSHAIGLTGFSTSTIDADGALRTLSIDRRAGTALYDAVVLATSELAKRPSGGRVLIVLTDGKDVSSSASLTDAIAAARHAGVAVYPIAIAGPEYTPRPLQALANATGGSFYRAGASSSLATVYSRIAKQLARTWQISYLTAARPGDRLDLRVSVPGQGAAARDVQVPAGQGGAAASSGPSRLLPQTFYTSAAGTAVIALAIGGLVLLGFFLVIRAQKSTWLKKRLEPHITPGRRAETAAPALRSVAVVIRATERTMGNLRQFRWLSRVLERADLPLRAAEFAYIILGCGFAVGLSAGVAAGSLFVFFIGALVGGLLPLGFVSDEGAGSAARVRQPARRSARHACGLDEGRPQLPSGDPVGRRRGDGACSDEFKRVLTDTQLGRPMEDALIEMADRVGSKDFTFVITAVTIQRQVGGSLASLFDMVAETVRQRQQFARRIRSLTAMGRMSAYVLVGLPFFLALVMTLINRKFMAPLFDTHSGHMMLLGGLSMMAVGSLMLKKIVSFRG